MGTIHVISEPNLSVTELTPHDANGNHQLESGEQSSFDITIKNTGDQASTIATATLTTETPQYVTINENTATIPALSPNQTTNLESAFGITISNNVPHETPLLFKLTMVSGNHTWRHDFSFNAFAPRIKIDDIMTIIDGGTVKGNNNGRLDPGETAEITFVYENIGGMTANDVVATLTTSNQQYITISNPTITTPVVNVGQSVEATYTVSVSANMPKGEAALFAHSYTVRPGQHVYTWTYEKDYSVSSGADCAWIDYIFLPPYLDNTAEQNVLPLTLYPNPTTDQVSIGLELEGDFIIQVFDANGQCILEEKNLSTLSFKGRPAGMYHIVVQQDGQSWSRRIIKM